MGAPPRMLRPPEGMLQPPEGLPGDTLLSFLAASAQPPEAAPVLGARPAFWLGRDPRSFQDNLDLRVRLLSRSSLGRARRVRPRCVRRRVRGGSPKGACSEPSPGLLISSRRPALTPSPGPSVHGRLSDPGSEYCLALPPPLHSFGATAVLFDI